MSELKLPSNTQGGASFEFRSRLRHRFELNCEALECRQLLSTSATSSSLAIATPSLQVLPYVSSGPTGLTPQQIQSAYGINQILFSGGQIVGNGAGQTIAIVTAYNDPNITSDLTTFDNAYGLSSPPSFTVSNLGATTNDAGWALETSLDVEWAHAIAPGANILLVEAPSDSLSNLFDAVRVAEHSGASVVSMSWGTTEFPGEQSFDALFNTPGVTFVAASGDAGAWYGPMYPSVSPNVLAVGGTSLTLSPGGGYGSETGWSGSTGGFSSSDSNGSPYETQPSYQTAALQASGLSSGARMTPDVSFNADPNSGVPVYDSVPYSGQSGWFQVGGTSAAAPAWAGLIAITDQGLSLAGKGALSSTQAISDLYALPRSDFHDITSGSNGYSATTGYDLVTGLGSPQANSVVAGLISLNGVSEISTSTLVQAGVAKAAHTTRTTSHLDTTTSQTGGGSSSGGSSITAGLSGASSILSLTSSLSGGNTLAGGTSILAFAPQTPGPQVQPTITQSTTVHVEEASTTSIAPGQSSNQTSNLSSRGLELDRASEPNVLTEEMSTSTVQPALPKQDVAPAALDTSEAPASEAPSPAPEVPSQKAPLLEAPAPEAEPAAPTGSPSLSVENFDLALAKLTMSYEEEQSSTSAAWPVFDRASDASASWKTPVLAGTVAVAAVGYRLALGRSDQIRKRWRRDRFE